jgi:hypothetical protein
MRFGVLFGWGITIYAIFFLVWSALNVYGVSQGAAADVIEILTLLAVCVIAGSSLKFRTWKDILPYSIGWAIIAALLDAFFAAPSGNWSLFTGWSPWIAYGLVALLPLLAVFFIKRETHRGAWET